MKPKGILKIAVVAAASIGLVSCGAAQGSEPSSAGDGMTKVTIAHDGTTSSAAVSLGIDQGFFKDENLEVEYLTLGTPPATTAALQGGQADVGAIPMMSVLNAMSKGIDLVPFASVTGFPRTGKDLGKFDTHGIYVDPAAGINRPKDLEGKDVAVPARQATLEILVVDAVVADGGDPAKINWIALDFGSQVTALTEGRVDAAALPLPFSAKAAEAGAELLFQPATGFFEEGPINTWNASPKLQDDTDLLNRLRRAIHKSNTYANEHSDEAIARAAEITGIDPSVLADSTSFNYYPTDLKVEDLERGARKMTSLGFLDKDIDLPNKVKASDG